MQRLERYAEVADAAARRRQGVPLLRDARRARGDARGAARARREDALRRPLAARAGQGAAADPGRRRAGDPLPQPGRRASSPGTTSSRARSRSPTTRSTTSSSSAPTASRPTTSPSSSTTGTCGISHVFRGDEHVNNTPWQINIFDALGAPLPAFAHVPIILGDDGQKLSKRRGAVSVTAYEDDGYLPEAMLNYLARLGWSHGDEEIFSREQMVAWFDGGHLSKSPAQWDPAKLDWVNAHYLKALDDDAPARRSRGAARAARHRRAVDATPCCAPAPSSRTAAAPARELADWLAIVFADVAPTRRRPGAARHRRRAAGAARRLRDKLAAVRVGQGGDRRGDQGDAGGARPEDAAARAGGARARLRPRARRRRSTPCSRCSSARPCWRAWRGLARRRRARARWL